jgi:hypothetical protein
MKHSEILAKAESSISGSILLGVTRVDNFTVTPDNLQITPTAKVEAGEYGIVELRILVPLEIKTSV